MTRKEHGLPPQPYAFFKKIHEYIISKGRGIVVLASSNGKIIAGAMYFHFGDKAVYKYSASDKTHYHRGASNLVMWEAIKWYSQNQYTSLCFGRTELENTGLRQYKMGWGAQEKIIEYFRYDLQKGTYIRNYQKTSRWYNAIFNNVPIGLSRIIGSILYKHMG
jgi:lipid II:glycine glycyltransferase (peptidoglycan interpeptide bridge formation enzyme)